MWRFVPRAVLSDIGLKDAGITCQHKEWTDSCDSRDTVLLAKQYMSASDWSQPPTLVMPVSVGMALEQKMQSELKPAKLLDLTPETKKQFLRTANAVEGDPWLLLKAGRYLRDLVEFSEDPSPTVLAPDIYFIKDYKLKSPSMDPIALPEYLKSLTHEDEPVRPIVVKSAGTAEIKRREKAAESRPTTALAEPHPGGRKRRAALDEPGGVSKKPACAKAVLKRPAVAKKKKPAASGHLPESLAAPPVPGRADALPEDDADSEEPAGEVELAEPPAADHPGAEPAQPPAADHHTAELAGPPPAAPHVGAEASAGCLQ